MISCLFWNLKALDRADLVAAACAEHGVALLMLAECQIDPREMIDALTNAGLPDFEFPRRLTGIEGGLRLFIRRGAGTLDDVEDDPNNHVTVRQLRGADTDALLVVAHLPSKPYAEALSTGRDLADLIRDVELRVGHARTVLVGDLNMNPFEAGVVNAGALHAVPTRAIARRGGRTVNGRDWGFFYNPMWQFFGERPDEAPGTYYYAATGRHTSYFWNVFDQVLARPSMMDRLSGVRILRRVGARDLLNSAGAPDLAVGSDHLPLLFNLDLGEVK